MFDCVAGNGSERGGAGSRKENPDSSPTGPGCARTCGEDEKSGVTGDCHAPFRGSPGMKLPGPPDLLLSPASYAVLSESPCGLKSRKYVFRANRSRATADRLPHSLVRITARRPAWERPTVVSGSCCAVSSAIHR